jgi:hypothetical protein
MDNLEIVMKNKYKDDENYCFIFNSYLRHKVNPDYKYIENIVTRNGLELEFVNEQDENLCEKALKQNPYSYVFIKDQNIRNRLWLFVILKDISLFEYVEQTEELCNFLLNKNGLILEYIKDKNPKYCYLAIKQNALAIQFVDNQTPQLCQMAVRKNGLALQYIKNQNHDLCLLAIRQNPIALEYVTEQTDKLIKDIIDNLEKWILSSENDSIAIFSRIKNQTFDVCKFFITLHPVCLKYIKSQSEKLSLENIEELTLLAIDKFFVKKNDYVFGFKENIQNLNDNEINFPIDIKKENNFHKKIKETYLKRNIDFEEENNINIDTNVMKEYNKLINERKEKINIISKDKKPDILNWIQLWTPKIYDKILKCDYKIIDFFNENIITEDMYLAVVKQDGLHLKYIKEQYQTENICKEAIKNNILAFEFVHNKTDDMCFLCLSKDHTLIQFIDNQTDFMCKIVFDKCKSLKNFDAFRYIKNKDIKLEKIAVKYDGLALEFIDNQNDIICESAVKQNGLALKFVKKQTEKICELAVEQNGLALEFVENKTDKICEIAMKQNPKALIFVDLLTENLIKLCKNNNDYEYNNNYILNDNFNHNEFFQKILIGENVVV